MQSNNTHFQCGPTNKDKATYEQTTNRTEKKKKIEKHLKLH